MLKRLARLCILLALSGAALGYGLWQHYNQVLRTPLNLPRDADHYYTIRSGMTMRTIADELAAKGVLRHPEYLVIETRRQGLGARLKAGEYKLEPGMTALDLLALFISDKVVQHKVTLLEGWTFKQVLAELHRHPKLVPTLKDLMPCEIMTRLGFQGYPEGRFLPDTYHFPAGTKDSDILKISHKALRRVLQKAWNERDEGLPYASEYDILIMASIIEKETGVSAERPRIAGVFTRRLHAGMRLQADPTVIYGLGEAFDGDLRSADLRADTPYNTYVHPGLTPTPIALPSVAAIDAAVHPAGGDELYFVAKGDGSHTFSATLEEHNRAVARYQLDVR